MEKIMITQWVRSGWCQKSQWSPQAIHLVLQNISGSTILSQSVCSCWQFSGISFILAEKGDMPYHFTSSIAVVVVLSRQLWESNKEILDEVVIYPHVMYFFTNPFIPQPQNLVLMGEFPDCDVKLCDFEISRVLTPGREVREVLGTPDYVGEWLLLTYSIQTQPTVLMVCVF